MAHAIARPRPVEQIGRIAHALHAAGEGDVGRAREDEVMGEHRRLHARAAHLVDGRRAHAKRQTGPEACLPRGRLALAVRQHATHHHLADIGPGDARAGQRGLDGAGAERWGSHISEVAEKSAHGRARRARDYDRIGHGASLTLLLPASQRSAFPHSRARRARLQTQHNAKQNRRRKAPPVWQFVEG